MKKADTTPRITEHLNTPEEPAVRGLRTAVGQGALEASGLGTLWLIWSNQGLLSITLPRGKRPIAEGSGPPVLEIPRHYADPLRRYFDGGAIDPALLPVDMHGTPFQLRVWNALRNVPRGRVRSYQGIAADIGSPRAMRAVGMANSKNPIPIVVPCHRVVEAGNRLGGYSGGLDVKIKLLELEGVTVDGDKVLPGQLDMF